MKKNSGNLCQNSPDLPFVEPLQGLLENRTAENNDLMQSRFPILVGRKVWNHLKSKSHHEIAPDKTSFCICPGVPVILREYLPDNILVADRKIYVFEQKRNVSRKTGRL